MPYRAFLIPGLEVPDFWSIARLQLTGEGLENSKGPASGLTDLTLTDLVAHKLGPFNAGLGFASVFPMATDSTLVYETVQALVTMHLPGGLFFSSDAAMTFYQKGGQSTVSIWGSDARSDCTSSALFVATTPWPRPTAGPSKERLRSTFSPERRARRWLVRHSTHRNPRWLAPLSGSPLPRVPTK